jgi:hypothetical protein
MTVTLASFVSRSLLNKSKSIAVDSGMATRMIFDFHPSFFDTTEISSIAQSSFMTSAINAWSVSGQTLNAADIASSLFAGIPIPW